MLQILFLALVSQPSESSAERIRNAVDAWSACVQDQGASGGANRAPAKEIARAAISRCAHKEADYRAASRAEYGDAGSQGATTALRKALEANLIHLIERGRCQTCLRR